MIDFDVETIKSVRDLPQYDLIGKIAMANRPIEKKGRTDKISAHLEHKIIGADKQGWTLKRDGEIFHFVGDKDTFLCVFKVFSDEELKNKRNIKTEDLLL